VAAALHHLPEEPAIQRMGRNCVAQEVHPRIALPIVDRRDRAAQFPVGTVVHGIPWHICPTVALHSEVVVARAGLASDPWPGVARARRINI
jgi:D-serine deaminase-like pyridoxal phosphate-dependent protein